MDECLEGWVHLGGSCFPVKFLEEEDVGLDKVADGVHDDLLIGIWKFLVITPCGWLHPEYCLHLVTLSFVTIIRHKCFQVFN